MLLKIFTHAAIIAPFKMTLLVVGITAPFKMTLLHLEITKTIICHSSQT